MSKDALGTKAFFKFPYTTELTNEIYNDIYEVLEHAMDFDEYYTINPLVKETFEKVVNCLEGYRDDN